MSGVRVARDRDCCGLEDPEVIYDRLLSHVSTCATCWPWRNQLWAVHRLCWRGAALADRYAVAEAARERAE